MLASLYSISEASMACWRFETTSGSSANRPEQLRASGIRPIVMLTGDNERTARAIGAEAGVDDVYADLSPDQKVEKVQQLSRQDGDGVNDERRSPRQP